MSMAHPYTPRLLSILAALLGFRAWGIELHAEHLASHATALWRSRRSQKLFRRNDDRKQVEMGVHSQHFSNVTTKLAYTRSEYIGTIGVGTARDGKGPQFEARVVFDTGSTNLWVASYLCKTPPCSEERAKHFYNPHESITQEFLEGEQDELRVVFGSGQLTGPIHVDTYRVGPMEVKKQPFAMIREMKGDVFSQFPFEGILGLGFKSMSFGGIEPFFERVIAQKLLAHNEFAFYINVDKSEPSALLWGGIDKDLYDGPIRMFPVVQPHYWAVELMDFRFGNMSLMDDSAPIQKVIFDTGTKFFTAPSRLYSKLMSHIPPATCEQGEAYPPLVYVLRGADGDIFNLHISPSTYLVAGRGLCRLAFRRMEVPAEYGPAMMLGELFMRHFFTVFSRGNGDDNDAKIGFAPAKIGAIPKVKHGSNPALLESGSPHKDKKSKFVRREIHHHEHHHHHHDGKA